MKVKTLPVAEIKPYPNNPRENEAAVRIVKDSIERHGYLQPITVDKNNVIITGHTRYAAIQELGWSQVDVIVLNISEKKAQKYRLADNKVKEKSAWDEDRLMVELRTLSEEVNDFFKDHEIETFDDRYVGKEIADISEKDIITAETKTEKKRGQAYELVEVTCPSCDNSFSIKPPKIKT